jgi:hypothetical protein
MKKAYRIPVVLLSVLSLLFALAAYAAEETPAGPPAKHRHHHRMYDAKTVETVAGEVVQVKTIPHRRGTGSGVHLILKTAKEEIPVHLGPSSYLEKQDVKIAQNDKIEVKGSRVTTKRGKPVLLAAEVKKGDALLKLRGENGVPLWGGKKEMKEKRQKEQ